MSLKLYHKKRNSTQSHEPDAGKLQQKGPLHFCVQKHAARRLHFDFRLEHQGVLLSWAIPKGPSLDPKDKRLAIKVEDHPLEYQYFEGTIPKGNYGAGTVEIWDHGTYTIKEAKNRNEAENYITQGLKKGHLDIIVYGDKLNGEFVLQQLKSAGQKNAWLLIKKSDSNSSSKEINNGQEKTSNHSKTKKKTKMPEFIPPMLAISMKNPFNNKEWLYEIKWDGYRALAFIDPPVITLKSRTKHNWNHQFPSIIENLKTIRTQTILDGELVILDAEGKPHFQLMQNYQKTGKGDLYYYVFDLLYKDGYDLRDLPLLERKELLKDCLEENPMPLIRFSDHIIEKGKELFNKIKKKHLEGIIAKKISSTYQSRRSPDWIKIKTTLRQEVVIGGFTAPRGSRKKFGSLLVGVYQDDKLQYSGHVGGGFDATLLKDVFNKLEPLVQKKTPFEITPRPNAPVTWVKPKLICEVSFAEWTQEGIMRHPIFIGLREDKSPKEIKRDIPMTNVKSVKNKQAKQEEVSLSNLDKIYWPQEKYTKGDLIEYYKNVASIMLPYLKNRPMSLHRFPDGIEGEHFFQKDITSPPARIKTCALKGEGKIDHYLLINDQKSLLYAVNLGSIELHPFLSREENLDYPDFCVIDLDPHGVDCAQVVKVALFIHDLLDKVKVRNYCKTSGGKGLHIFIPLHAKYTYEQSRQFAEIISLMAHEAFPSFTSLDRNPQKRPKKIYLDCLQNRKGQTIVAPYSVRPNPHAPVSTPLHWDELNDEWDPLKYNIKTILPRIEKMGDIFKPVLGAGINLETALKRLVN